ncbi:MAG: hypothetical protein AMXMBFR53_02300 [Gemmatimonadota bacterium]
MLVEFLRDARYAVRSHARHPLFAAALVVTLALGIGSNVAIFSVANAVVFRPLPYEQPEELALIWTRLGSDPTRVLVSGPDLQDFEKETTLFEGFAGAMAIPGTLTGDGPAEQIITAYSTWNIFQVLGVRPHLGRIFAADDAIYVDPEMFGAPNPDLPPGTVVLSHALWQRRFGGDPSVVGRTIQMDGFGSVVVGVLPPDFQVYLPADAAMPTNIDAWGVLPSNISEFARDASWLTVVARMKDGVEAAQAQQEMDALAARLRDTYQFHANRGLNIVVAGMHDDVVRHARPTLLALLGSVAFVLLIACGNVANLLLVRASGREREIAVRAALGSGHGRIIRQMLTESAVLAVAGAAGGAILAWWGVRVVASLSPGNLPRMESAIDMDPGVMVFTVLITAAAALAFGLAPAHRAVRADLAGALKDRGSDSGGVRGNKLRTALVVSEMALSLVLLVGAGLMFRSFSALKRVEPGFEAEGVVTFTAPLQFTKYYNSATRAAFYTDLARRLEAVPGVESVGGVAPLPLAGAEQYSVTAYGRPGDPDEAYESNKADIRVTLPGFFEAMGIRLVAGRSLLPSDNVPEALSVAVVDRKFAERAFGDEDPLGKEVLLDHFNEQTFSLERAPVQIVGIVENVRSTSLAAEGRETVYVPYIFQAFLPATFTIRTAVDPAGLAPRFREAVAALDPDVPISDLAPLTASVSRAMAPTRFVLALLGTFAVIALILASLGLYGVISYSVEQRNREIGVRMAFGATGGEIVQLVLRHGLLLALSGIGLGLAASLAVTRVARSLFVSVSATDPLTFTAVAALLLGVAALAAWIPSRRATLVDPVVALRDE